MGLWFIKKRIVEHELDEYADHYVEGLNLDPEVKAWLLAIGRGLIAGVLTGGVTYGADGHISWSATAISVVLTAWHLVEQSPMPRKVWTDAERKLQEAKDAAK